MEHYRYKSPLWQKDFLPISVLLSFLEFSEFSLCPEEDCISLLPCSLMWPCDKILSKNFVWNFQEMFLKVKNYSSSDYNVIVTAEAWSHLELSNGSHVLRMTELKIGPWFSGTMKWYMSPRENTSRYFFVWEWK